MPILQEETYPKKIEDNSHVHTGTIYSINSVNQTGLLVCKDCHPKELIGGNECFDKCHQGGKARCRGCKGFHITVLAK